MWNPTINIDQQIWSEQTTSDEVVWDNETLNDAEWNESHSAAWYFDEENVNDDIEEWDEEPMLGNTRWWSEWHYTILDQMPEFEREDITVCDPDDITNCITMMDRDLWARLAFTWTSKQETLWYHYQWWNNYGFAIWCDTLYWSCSDDITTYSVPNILDFDDSYLGSWYFDNVFHIWKVFSGISSQTIAQIWWWWNDNSWNNYWYDLDNFEDRQWPCPEWYHIPSVWEYSELVKYWAKNYLNVWNTPQYWEDSIIFINGDNIAQLKREYVYWFKLYFHMPSSLLYRDWSNGMITSSTNYYILWLSSIGYNTAFHSSSYDGVAMRIRGWWNDWRYIRCFQNSYSKTWLTVQFKNGSTLETQIVPVGETVTQPIDPIPPVWYQFDWWYIDRSYHWGAPRFDFSIPITADLRLQALFSQKRYSVVWRDENETYEMWYEYYWNRISPIDTWNMHKDWYIFAWWYTDKELTKPFNFKDTIVTSDINIYAKWEFCPDWYLPIDNKCISESAWVFYESWVIKVTDGERMAIYIKDRNQWVDSDIWYKDISEFNDLLSTWESCYADLYTQKSKWLNKREVSEDSSNFVCPDESEIYGRLSEISWYPVVSNNDLDSAKEYLNQKLYWTYYYRWNNTWAYYEELNVNWEDINIDEETFMRWFNGWKINWLEQWWINTDDGNSPCDASKWEYLPTAEQWQGLRDLYYNINRSMDNFEQDLLIPQAWNIYYHDSSMDAKKWFKSSLSLRDFFWQAVIAEEIDVFRTISNKYKPYSSLLWLAINENSQNWDDENIGKGIMDNIYAVDRWQYYGLDNISNDVAAPVRCFIKWNDEFVVKYYIDWEELFSETILSWNRAEQPKISQKEWYTFKWRYTEDWKTYDFSVPVTSDIELYARFEQNKSSSSNWWWGGWSSLKKDNCTDWDYSDSYYDWTCGKKKVVEDSSAMPQNDGKGSEDSPTKPQSNKTWHNSANEVVYDTLKFNPHYSDEMNRAYQFAYHYGITTKTNIKDAAMNWELTRIAMAKMLSQYAINVLWIQPDKGRNNKFADVSDKLDTEYDDGVTLAYQLWIMWINMPNNEFRPYNYVTRGEFATALSRLLYHTSDWMFEKTSRYYVPHINKLAYEWILTNTDPAMKELRWYVMLMLMRSAK